MYKFIFVEKSEKFFTLYKIMFYRVAKKALCLKLVLSQKHCYV
jgi:hypothetical protein